MKDTPLRAVRDILMSSEHTYLIRSEDEHVIHFTYREEAKKASCFSACCLGLLFLPLGIIYAIVGGGNAKNKNFSIFWEEGKLFVEGDPRQALTIYNNLQNYEISDYLVESEAIKKGKKIQFWLILFYVLLFIFFIAAYSNS